MYENEMVRDRFKEIFEGYCGIDVLNDKDDGGLITYVSTGRTICDFDVQIDFFDDVIRFSTMSHIGVENKCKNYIDHLISSINNCENRGGFFVNKEGKLSSLFFSSFDELLNIENPFDLIDYGIEMFNRYSDAILKALLGQIMTCAKLS